MKDLELVLQRVYQNVKTPNGVGTFGKLYLSPDDAKRDKVFLYTLEDEVRDLEKPISEVKVPKMTAISAKRYEFIVNLSPKFNRFLPLLIGVEGFIGVRIHSGATVHHTDGCVLVGMQYAMKGDKPVRLLNGQEAEIMLMERLGQVSNNKFVPNFKKFYITIKNASHV